MAEPTVITTENAVDGGDEVLTIGSGSPTVGQLLVMFAVNSNSTGRKLSAITDWFLLIEDNSGAFVSQVFYKYATGSEPSTYDWPCTDAFHGVTATLAVVDGAEDPGVTAIVAGSNPGPTGGVVVCPSVTPTDDESLIFRAATSRRNTNFTVPTGDTLVDHYQDGGKAVAVAKNTHGATATGTKDFTFSPGWHSNLMGFTLAIAPAAAPATVTLTDPNGGEELTPGSTFEITWTSENTSGNVKIEYSKDGFASDVNVIEASTTDDGTYNWTVPNDPSATVTVRISDAGDAAVVDVSDANFTILATAPEVGSRDYDAAGRRLHFKTNSGRLHFDAAGRSIHFKAVK